ncbi:acyl-CoA dehydrogenase family protein [Actinoplanes utahensis]|uniref:Acyl-CoA dehydrogenase n=1 Tax=Actinoplanes utahensis TaxID=1869 RepID=A0A0A6WWM0_ACTUT|nr:acyl-CoA dehydrogenase family protein [Actinoplanes utahensis]KHD72097.1 acyl-CoA dehydrogenase [Actinoplanes utahensis]GIF28840.1 acyl-CoA dehydrogenase [Actinoplanes utahensis]
MTVTPSRAAESVLPVLTEHAAAVDAAARFPEEGMQALRASGLLGLLVPAEHGGMGGGLSDLLTVGRTLASACSSTAMIWAMHCQQVDALVRHATPRLHTELLPRIASGEVYLASVTTEAATGGRLLTAAAALHETGELLDLRREAPIVTGGLHADGYLVTMRAGEEASRQSVSLVYVDRDQLDYETAGTWDPLGMRGTQSVAMTLTASVPRHHVVGVPGEFRDVAVDSMIPVGHLGWAACWLGAAQGALRDVVRLIGSRRRPGSLDPASDLVRERLARVRLDLELVSAYVERAAAEVMEHRAAGTSLDEPTTQIHLNVVKVAAAELTFGAVNRLVQLVGMSTGYMRTSSLPLERVFRDLRSASLNNADDRLLVATGALSLLDRGVRLAGQ